MRRLRMLTGLCGRLISALGAAAGLSCTFMLIHELLSPENSKKAISYTLVFFTIGIALSVMIGGVMTQYLGWQSIFYVLLLYAITMFALTFVYHEPSFLRYWVYRLRLMRRGIWLTLLVCC